MTDLKGKTALVTGSTSGIGKATAIALADRGAHVLVVGRDEQRAKDVVAEIEGCGGTAQFRLTTLADLQSTRDLVEWATEAGDGHVDILINNAGVALLGPSSAATEAEFDASFALNVKVPFFLVAALAPAMAERGWGSIVNVSTMVASFGRPAWLCTAPAERLSNCSLRPGPPNTARVVSGSTPLPPARRAPG